MGVFRVRTPDGREALVNAPDPQTAAQMIDDADIPDFQGGAAFDEAGAPQPPPELGAAMQQRDMAGPPGSPLVNAFHGFTAGFGDEIAGAFGGVVDMLGAGPQGFQGSPLDRFGQGYERERDLTRRQVENYRQSNPNAAMAAEIAGALPTALIPGGAAVRGASLAEKAIRSGIAGGAYGGAYGFGEGEGGLENRLESAATGAAVGGAVGGAIPVAGRAIGNRAGRKAGRRAAPSVEAISEEAGDLFKKSRESGVGIRQDATRRLQAVRKRMMGPSPDLPRVDAQRHPNTMDALDTVSMLGGKRVATFDELMTARELINDSIRSAKLGSPDRAKSTEVLRIFDDWYQNLKPKEVGAGKVTAREAMQMWQKANKLWASKKKGDVLADMYEAAERNTDSAGSMERALRNEFKKLANNKNRMSQFSKSEQAEINEIAKGQKVDRLIRTVGQWVPEAFKVKGVGNVARNVSGRGTRRKADTLDATIRGGGANPFNEQAARSAENAADQIAGTIGQASAPQMAREAGPLELGFTPGSTPANAPGLVQRQRSGY